MKKIQQLIFQFPHHCINVVLNYLIREKYISIDLERHGDDWKIRYHRLRKFKTEDINKELQNE